MPAEVKVDLTGLWHRETELKGAYTYGTETLAVRARVAEGDEREELWTAQKTAWPQFQGYEDATTRTIPVVVLERV